MKSQRSSSAKARLEHELRSDKENNGTSKKVLHGSKRPQSAIESREPHRRIHNPARPSAKLTICSVGQQAKDSDQLSEGNAFDISTRKRNEVVKEQRSEKSSELISIPRSLGPLGQWLCRGIPSELTGLKSECLMFLPSLLNQRPEDLPVVPLQQSVDDDLAYINVIPEEIKPETPKKYDHPWKKLPIKEYKCNHNKGKNMDALRIYSPEGKLLHETYTGARNELIVRKEIKELEDLMIGIGNDEGISIIVQYQAEINEIQSMLSETMPRVKEIERREAQKLAAMEPIDSFGLRKFAKHHEEVMLRIKRQWEACVQELAALEDELGIITPRAHFKLRSKSVTSCLH